MYSELNQLQYGMITKNINIDDRLELNIDAMDIDEYIQRQLELEERYQYEIEYEQIHITHKE